MLDLLEMFGGSFPLSMIPSKTSSTSYMRLLERMNARDLNNTPRDAHHPDAIMKKLWSNIEQKWYAPE